MSKPDWNTDGRDWPNREASCFVVAGGLRWHVQVAGDGPVLLLLHGAGAATHSWRDVLPLLAEHYTVVAPDLPGHGFTATPAASGLTIPGMARGIAALLAELGLVPTATVGHSAGAGIALRLVLDGLVPPVPVISLNGALLPFPGIAAKLFPGIARLLFVNPLMPRILSLQARQPGAVERVIRGTGSMIDPAGVELYRRLFARSGHVAGTLGMMANWDLESLRRDLSRLKSPLELIAGDRDGTVPASVSRQVAGLVPGARYRLLPGLGHLMHEQDPPLLARLIRDAASGMGASPSPAGA